LSHKRGERFLLFSNSCLPPLSVFGYLEAFCRRYRCSGTISVLLLIRMRYWSYYNFPLRNGNTITQYYIMHVMFGWWFSSWTILPYVTSENLPSATKNKPNDIVHYSPT
jgi:hypothetical protein